MIATTIPGNTSDEIIILSTALCCPNDLPDIRQLVRVSDFTLDTHAALFQFVCDVADRGKGHDAYVVFSELASAGRLSDVGGKDAFWDIAESAPTLTGPDGTLHGTNHKFHAGKVRDAARKRTLLSLGHRLPRMIQDAESADQVIESLQAELFRLDGGTATGRATSLGDALQELVGRMEKISRNELELGLQTGFHGIDDAVGGFEPGDLVVLAAPTGAGKSTLAKDVAAHVASQGRSVLIVSAEMTEREVARRFLQGQTGIDGVKMKTANLNVDNWQRVHQAVGEMEQWPVRIIGNKVTTATVRAEAMKMTAELRRPVGLVIADYVQLLQATHGDNREQQVASIAWDLKALAMETGSVVLLVSQLNRQSADTLPELHHLRESGALEQHANFVLLMHQSKNVDLTDTKALRVWVRVAKARDGKTTPWDGMGAVRLHWRPNITAFVGDEILTT